MNEREKAYEAQVGCCSLDTDLRYVEINEWLAVMNGLSPADHVGRTISEILPDVAEKVMGQLRHVLDTGQPLLKGLAYAETAAHPGTKRLYQHDYHPLRSADGIVAGVRCTVRDITHDISDLKEALVEVDNLRQRVEDENLHLRKTLRLAAVVLSDSGLGSGEVPASTRLEDVERAHILRVLTECNWRIKGKANAAEKLGLHPSTLASRLKKLGIKQP